MATAFAQLEGRVNAACGLHLANASSVYRGGTPFGVLFDRMPDDPFGGAVDATTRQVSCEAALVVGICAGHELLVDGVVYVVTGPVQPDTTGWLTFAVYPLE